MIFYAVLAPVALFMLLWALYFKPLAGIALATQAAAKGMAAWVARTGLGKRAQSSAAWTRARTYSRIVIVLMLGVAAAIGAGVLFTEIAERVRVASSAVNRFDQAVWSFLATERFPWLTSMFDAATLAGGWVGMVSLVLVTAAVLVKRNDRSSAVFVVGTAAGGELLNTALKAYFARARPDLSVALASANWYSFPSGHAMSSFIVLGAISYVVLRQPWRWKVKSAFLAGATSFVLLVGLSRVYLGVHWASDIAGGWTAATMWLAAVTVAFELALRRRKRG